MIDGQTSFIDEETITNTKNQEESLSTRGDKNRKDGFFFWFDETEKICDENDDEHKTKKKSIGEHFGWIETDERKKWCVLMFFFSNVFRWIVERLHSVWISIQMTKTKIRSFSTRKWMKRREEECTVLIEKSNLKFSCFVFFESPRNF